MIILLFVFLSLTLFYIFFLFRISVGLASVVNDRTENKGESFVSIIIPFRNEAENILKSLNSIKSQTLNPELFEVIYINDNSTDNSLDLLEVHDKPSNIIIINSPVTIDDRAHKKKALKHAIDLSKGSIIISTDADCIHSETWLETMLSSFDESTAFVSGPVEFINNYSLFNELQRVEFSSLILVGAGLIGIKAPIICNAANLGFRKNVFYEVGGYEDNLNLSSGDDEFLMQKISRTTNNKVKFCFNKNAMVFTNANKTLSEFYHQRKRWASKSLYYVEKKITIQLVLVFLFYLSIPLQLVLGFTFESIFLVSALLTFIVKIIFEYKIVHIDSRQLFSKSSVGNFLIAEFVHIPYILISAISGIFGNYKWKGRNVER